MARFSRTATITLSALAFAVCLVTAAPRGDAAPINYGDFAGNSVMFLDVTETANSSGDSEPLYGGPSVIGDTLDFNPGGFVADSLWGGLDITDGQLNFALMALGGTAVTSFSLSDFGDYTLVGMGTAATQVTYAISAAVVVLEVDGVALGAPLALATTSASGTDSLGSGVDVLTPWNLTLDYDVNAALANAGIDFSTGATKIEVIVDNQLTAIGEATTLSFIAKKDFMVDVVTVIPEPTTALLLGLSLIGLGAASRREVRA